MRLSSLKIAGFRGIKGSVELDIPPGFVVITGRNGSGKSTICDAIEYALTGEIRLNTDRKERGESIQDYIWWRGTDSPPKSYVSIGITDEIGNEITISRSPKGVVTSNDIGIESCLVDEELAPEDCLRHLCKTAIIRDEEITNLSLDLPEIQRFDFVRSSIGTFDFSEIENKVKNIQKILQNLHSNLQAEYESVRRKISDTTARLSEAKIESSKEADANKAETIIKDILGTSEEIISDPLNAANKAIPVLRTNTDNLVRVLNDLQNLEKRLSEIRTDDFKQKVAKLQNQLATLEQQLGIMREEIEQADKLIADHEKEKPFLTSLAQINEHGRRLGLEDGSCPLCGSQISDQEFNAHLLVTEQRIKGASEQLSDLTRKRVTLARKRDKIIGDLEGAKKNLEELTHLEARIGEEIRKLRSNAANLGFDVSSDEDLDNARLAEHIEKNRKKVRDLELAITILETSRAYARVSSFEKELKSTRLNVSNIEKRMARMKQAEHQAKEAVRVVKRVSGEVVDERLAELSPLMSELYFRLRPHVDWRQIGYYIRGDVRRFLSFEVGSGLNPSFIFSSGQRRAAGLAFLLAVHLSRTWCLLQTLILDDPVQHVDDYRALHLSEVLSAIRQLGRQIICTVEDHALAELLCRRLRCTAPGEGALINLVYDSEVGIRVSTERIIHPMSSQVLLSA